MSNQSGQTATEYLLYISVISIALVALTIPLWPAFQQGFQSWSQAFTQTYGDNQFPEP